jgi:RNA polymerase sigma-70 factor (ECF subfamily)
MQRQTQRTSGVFDYSPVDDVDAVIDRYSSMVYKIALTNMRSKFDAEDVFQEVFLRYMKNTKPFASEEHRKAWLIRVTVNCCKSAYLSPWNNNVSLEDIGEVADSMTEDEKDVYKEVLNLPMDYKTVIILFYYENMSVNSIARSLGISEGAVKMRLSRARNLLKLNLEGDEDDTKRQNGDNR